jgi:hypothetical protein
VDVAVPPKRGPGATKGAGVEFPEGHRYIIVDGISLSPATPTVAPVISRISGLLLYALTSSQLNLNI